MVTCCSDCNRGKSNRIFKDSILVPMLAEIRRRNKELDLDTKSFIYDIAAPVMHSPIRLKQQIMYWI